MPSASMVSGGSCTPERGRCPVTGGPTPEIVEHKWTSSSGIAGSGPQLTLRADQIDFDHPGGKIDLTLTVKDNYDQVGSEAVETHYGNSPPTIRSISATDNGRNGMVFSAACVDADLTSPQQARNPQFEQLTVAFSYNGKVFHTGNGLVGYGKLLDVFGAEGKYLIFARVTDYSGDLDLEPAFVTIVPEPATLMLLAAGAMAISRRKRPGRSKGTG